MVEDSSTAVSPSLAAVMLGAVTPSSWKPPSGRGSSDAVTSFALNDSSPVTSTSSSVTSSRSTDTPSGAPWDSSMAADAPASWDRYRTPSPVIRSPSRPSVWIAPASSASSWLLNVSFAISGQGPGSSHTCAPGMNTRPSPVCWFSKASAVLPGVDQVTTPDGACSKPSVPPLLRPPGQRPVASWYRFAHNPSGFCGKSSRSSRTHRRKEPGVPHRMRAAPGPRSQYAFNCGGIRD